MRIFRQYLCDPHIKTIEWDVKTESCRIKRAIVWIGNRSGDNESKFLLITIMILRFIHFSTDEHQYLKFISNHYFCTSSCHARSPECIARPIIKDTWLQHLFICCDICSHFTLPELAIIYLFFSLSPLNHNDHHLQLENTNNALDQGIRWTRFAFPLSQRINPPTTAIIVSLCSHSHNWWTL